MKNWFYIVFWLLGGLCCTSVHACEMTVRTYPFPPLAIQHPDKSWSGVDIGFSKALVAAIGCKINYVIVPWARSLELLKSGDIDMMVNVTKSAKREEYYHFVGPQRYETIRLVSIKGAFEEVATWQQFAMLDATLMRQKGSLFDAHFEKALKSNFRLKSRLVELRSNEIRMNLLKKGRIDGVFVDEFILAYRMKTDKTLPPLEVHPLVMSQIPVYFAFSKKNYTRQQIAQFERVFDRLSQTPEYEQLNQNR